MDDDEPLPGRVARVGEGDLRGVEPGSGRIPLSRPGGEGGQADRERPGRARLVVPLERRLGPGVGAAGPGRVVPVGQRRGGRLDGEVVAQGLGRGPRRREPVAFDEVRGRHADRVVEALVGLSDRPQHVVRDIGEPRPPGQIGLCRPRPERRGDRAAPGRGRGEALEALGGGPQHLPRRRRAEPAEPVDQRPGGEERDGPHGHDALEEGRLGIPGAERPRVGQRVGEDVGELAADVPGVPVAIHLAGPDPARPDAAAHPLVAARLEVVEQGEGPARLARHQAGAGRVEAAGDAESRVPGGAHGGVPRGPGAASSLLGHQRHEELGAGSAGQPRSRPPSSRRTPASAAVG